MNVFVINSDGKCVQSAFNAEITFEGNLAVIMSSNSGVTLYVDVSTFIIKTEVPNDSI